jgi:hypothetical protein
LAEEIGEIRRTRGFMGDMTDAEAFRVPEELEDIVGRLSLVSTAGFAEWNPQREAILDLLDLVRSTTGRYHYQEVAQMIEGQRLWVAAKYQRPFPDMKFDADSLKMILRRHKQRVNGEDERRKKQQEALAKHKEEQTKKCGLEYLYGLGPKENAEASS